MKLIIYRSGPTPHYDTYKLPFNEEDRITLMDAFEYIWKNIDPTLGYFSHGVCNHGICGRCLVRVNGKPALACTKLACDGQKIDPKNDRVIRDIFCKD